MIDIYLKYIDIHLRDISIYFKSLWLLFGKWIVVVQNCLQTDLRQPKRLFADIMSGISFTSGTRGRE